MLCFAQNLMEFVNLLEAQPGVRPISIKSDADVSEELPLP